MTTRLVRLPPMSAVAYGLPTPESPVPINQITSQDGSVTVTSPYGPVTDLEVTLVHVTSQDASVTIRNLPGPIVDLSVQGGVDTIPFVYPGALSLSTSPGIRPRQATTVTGFSVTLGTAGTSNTVVSLLKNGTSVASVTLVSGDTYESVSFAPVTFAARADAYAMQITTAGSGAADLGGEIELQ